MKPNFALKLSNDGAELLHRVAAGWSPVGAVSFETDDVAAGCARLLREAAALDPTGIRTKVVIPPDEVRYAMIVAPGPTDEARRYQIEAEIERLTPYTIDELAYDWAVEDDHALVVICARETLAEAETFAEGYGFNPVCFVAIPEAGQFVGEPWFGEALVAKVHVPAGQRVQRDVEAIRIVARATRPVASPPVAAPPAASPVAAPPVVTAAVPPQAAARAAPPVLPQPVTAAVVKPSSSDLPARPAAAQPVVAQPVSVSGSAPVAPPRPQVPPAVAAALAQRAANPAPAPAARPAISPPAAKADPRALVGDMVRRLGTRLRREQAAATSEPTAVAPPAPVAPPGPAAPAPEAVAFASRRSAAPAISPVPSSPAARSTAPGPGGRIAVLPANAPRKGVEAASALLNRARGAALARVSALRRTAPEGPAPIVATSRPPTNDRDRSREAAAMTIFGARGNTAEQPSMARRGLMVAGGLLLILVAVAVWALYFSPDDTSQLADAGSETTTLPQIEQPSQLVAEAPAAASAVAPLPAPDAAPAAAAATDPTAAETATETAAAPASDDPDAMLETLVQQALDETLPAETVATAEAAAAEASQPVASAPAPEPAPESAASPAAASDTAQAPSLDSTPAGALPEVAASTDTPLDQVPEALAMTLSLPSGIALPTASEVAFAPPPPPPPFGTTFTFDAQGLVEATAEGAVTPAGVTVYARRPPVAPVPRAVTAAAPAAPAAQAVPSGEPVAAAIEAAITEAVSSPEPVAAPAADPAAAAGPQTEVVLDDTPRADPALAGARPRPRSERVRLLSAPPAAEPAPATAPPVDDQTLLQPADPGTETAALAPTAADPLETPPPGGVSLVALRPQARPTDIVPVAAPPPGDSGVDLTGATPEAVAQSPVPSARPDDVAERARQILAAARAPAPAASTETVEDESGETASSAAEPSIPSSASVARQATETNAIDLGEINLIGVFGAPGDRRALVRLSSGRMVRLQVGDRIDGGEVSAIGENELRYTVNGRNEVLRIGG